MIRTALDENEEIVVLIRKHWLIFFLQALALTVLALLPLVAFMFIPPQFQLAFEQMQISSVFPVFLYLIFVLFIWEFAFIQLTTYYLDVWVVTNRRVIDINQRTLFARDTTTLMLEKIQDATVEVRGLLATLFNFGTLIIHTAGDNDDIVIRYAANPQYAKDKILECERIASAKRADGV